MLNERLTYILNAILDVDNEQYSKEILSYSLWITFRIVNIKCSFEFVRINYDCLGSVNRGLFESHVKLQDSSIRTWRRQLRSVIP